MLLSQRVLRNFGSLVALQAGTYLMPLLLVPYQVRVLGLGPFGTWMFAMAFVIMARVCVNYGFDLTATRHVAAQAKDNPTQISELLADVTAARLVIWIGTLGILLGLSLCVGQLAGIRLLLVAACFILLGEALFPVWLFQGMETMGAITVLRLGSKLTNLILVVALVKGPDDLLLIPVLEAATSLGMGVASLMLARNRFGLHLVRPQIARIRTQLVEGAHLFLATLAAQFYTTVNMILLGLLVGPAAVGAYSLAEKIYSALRGLLGPFVQAIFPAMARLHNTSQQEFAHNYRNVLLYLMPLLVLIGLTLFFSASRLVKLASGSDDGETVRALQLFAASFPFAVGSFLSPMLVVRGHSEKLMRITIIGALLGLALSLLLANEYGVTGAVTAFLIVQVFNSIALVLANRSSR